MRTLLVLSSFLMAKADSHRASGGSAAADKPAESQANYTESVGNPEDGQQSQGFISEGIELLNKIVAKNIVKRSQLNYRKEPRKDAAGNVIKDAEGNALEVIVDPEPRLLYRIFGTASEIRHGDSSFGPWTSFKGNFEAHRFSDGKRFRAPECFLNGAAEGLLEDALVALHKTDPAGTLSFCFDIGVKPSNKWESEGKGNSYEYTVTSIIESTQHDPLKELRERAMKNMPKRLAAPT